MFSPTALKTRQICFFRHPVQFTLLQALAFKGEEYQLKGYKLENITFFCSSKHPCICFPASLFPFTLSFSHVSLFLKYNTFGLPQITINIYIYLLIVYCGWLFFLLSKEDNVVHWKWAHRWTALCCTLYVSFSVGLRWTINACLLLVWGVSRRTVNEANVSQQLSDSLLRFRILAPEQKGAFPHFLCLARVINAWLICQIHSHTHREFSLI